jgi:hypothetical protein
MVNAERWSLHSGMGCTVGQRTGNSPRQAVSLPFAIGNTVRPPGPRAGEVGARRTATRHSRCVRTTVRRSLGIRGQELAKGFVGQMVAPFTDVK